MAVKISPLGRVVKIWDIKLENSLLGIILLLVGITILVYGWSILGQGLEVKGWERTQAMVVHSDLDAKWVSSIQASGRVEWKKKYSADLAYTYSVNQTKYRSNRIGRYKSWDNIPDEQNRILAKYPKWTKIDIYYHKDDPANSMVEPNLAVADFFVLTLGGIMTGLGLLAIVKS